MERHSSYGEFGSDDWHLISNIHSMKRIQWAQGVGEGSAKTKSGEAVSQQTPIDSWPRAVFFDERCEHAGPASLDLWAAASTVKLGQEPECFH